VVNATPRPLYARERDPAPVVQEAGRSPGPVWTRAENLAPTGIRSAGCPALSELLYLLLYPGPHQVNVCRFTDYFISYIRQHVSILTEPPSRR
jgi:hypothetical protein